MIAPLRRAYFRQLWRRLNRHNLTTFALVPQDATHFRQVKVGTGTYGPIYAPWSGNPDERLEIGDYCSIGGGVKFMLGSEHETSHISTYPWKVRTKAATWEAVTRGPIVVQDDVWIGEDALILSGVTVGKGAVVGARSVVTKNVPPYAVVSGVPARTTRFRFEPEIVEKLLAMSVADLRRLAPRRLDLLYSKLDRAVLEEILRELKSLDR